MNNEKGMIFDYLPIIDKLTIRMALKQKKKVYVYDRFCAWTEIPRDCNLRPDLAYWTEEPLLLPDNLRLVTEEEKRERVKAAHTNHLYYLDGCTLVWKPVAPSDTDWSKDDVYAVDEDYTWDCDLTGYFKIKTWEDLVSTFKPDPKYMNELITEYGFNKIMDDLLPPDRVIYVKNGSWGGYLIGWDVVERKVER